MRSVLSSTQSHNPSHTSFRVIVVWMVGRGIKGVPTQWSFRPSSNNGTPLSTGNTSARRKLLGDFIADNHRVATWKTPVIQNRQYTELSKDFSLVIGNEPWHLRPYESYLFRLNQVCVYLFVHCMLSILSLTKMEIHWPREHETLLLHAFGRSESCIWCPSWCSYYRELLLKGRYSSPCHCWRRGTE